MGFLELLISSQEVRACEQCEKWQLLDLYLATYRHTGEGGPDVASNFNRRTGKEGKGGNAPRHP